MTITELKEKYDVTQATIALWSGTNQSIVSYYRQNPELVTVAQRQAIEIALAEMDYLASVVIPEMQAALPGFSLNLRNVAESKKFLATARQHIETDKAQRFIDQLSETQHGS